jgi:hypothetical protein
VLSGANADPGNAGAGGKGSEDAEWVRDFLLTEPGKTFWIDPAADARGAVAGEAVAAAARSLVDDVVRAARSTGQADRVPPAEPT